jgi:hypothetical protein
MTMRAKATRPGAARRSPKRQAVDSDDRLARTAARYESEPDDWEEVQEETERLEEGEMEILLTGHAATHGIEGEDNWLIETEEEKWGER